MTKTRAHLTVFVAVAGAALIVPLTPPAAAQPAPLAAPANQARQAPAATPAPATPASYDELSLTPAAGARAAAVAVNQTKPFSMIGVTWPYRASSADVTAKMRVYQNGVWTAWQPLHIEEDTGFDAAQTNRGRSGTEPFWVGLATGVQVSVTTPDGATLRDAKVSLINPGTRAEDATLQDQALPTGRAAAASPAPFPMAPIATRAAWGADERLRSYNGAECATPKRGSTVFAAFVHHTADTNNYSKAQVPALLRSTLAYHVKSRGWCDIGYNFLVDKYGRAFEGRFGGMQLPVTGAHTGGYNLNSFGISLIGNYDVASPSAATMDRVARIIAWKFDTNYRSPLTTTVLAGKRLNTVSGHRDTKQTACPGKYVYSKLPALRQKVWALQGKSASTEISRYAAYLGGSGAVGQPFWGEHATGVGGRTTWFNVQDIYFSGYSQPRAVYGAFRTRYRALNNALGVLGMPMGWQSNGVVAGTYVQTFRNGRLYRSNVTAAHPVYGAIYFKYKSLGAERSKLGLPTMAAYKAAPGLKQAFQHGWMSWNSSNGVVQYNVTS